MGSSPPGTRASTDLLAIVFDSPFGHSPVYVHNEFSLSGRAHGPAPVEDVRVELEERVYHASRGLPRPGAESAGFELRLSTEAWTPGSRRVRVIARDATGYEAVVEGEVDFRPFERPAHSTEDNIAAIAAGRTAMWCELPRLDGSSHAVTPVRIEGWAWCARGINNVTVDVDGTRLVHAQYGLARPDLREPLGEEVAASGGFAVTLDPAECAPGWHRITVVASGADGRNLGATGLVECLANADSEPTTPRREAISPTLLADRYVPEAHVGYSFEPEHHARYRWAATLAQGRRVLDAGCGTGFGTAILARAGAESTEGFDVSLEVVEHARDQAGEVAEFVVGDLRRVPYGDDSFDLITCFEAIEHVDDPFRALDELHRVLARGGVLLISTPNRGVYAEGNPHHLHELTSDEFEVALRERFRWVQMFRQQTHATSLIGSDESFAVRDSATPLDVQVRKVAGAIPGQELYTVAVVSDDPLPDLPEFAVLGSAVDMADRIRVAEAWKQRALLAEATAARERVEARRSAEVGQAAEAKRLATEAALESAEAARRTAEAARRTAEATLRSAEGARQSADAARSDAEKERSGALADRERALAELDKRRSPLWRLRAGLHKLKGLARR